LGGTKRGGHQGVESLALSLMIPPNGGGGAGSCEPCTVVVASGEPGTPVTTWEDAGVIANSGTNKRLAKVAARQWPNDCRLMMDSCRTTSGIGLPRLVDNRCLHRSEDDYIGPKGNDGPRSCAAGVSNSSRIGAFIYHLRMSASLRRTLRLAVGRRLLDSRHSTSRSVSWP
jgi:hypothetical protein